MEPISLLEGALVELQGAARRFAVANQALQDFEAIHAGKVVSAELAEPFAHERDLFETELDAARRRYEECERQYREMRGDL